MLKKKTTATKRASIGGRPIDRAADDVSTWWQRSYVFMKKTQVKTWQSALILAFVTGVAISLILSARMGWHIFSSAAEPVSTLSFADTDVSATVGEDVPVDVVLNTQGNNVVATRVVVQFNKNNFQYVGYDTTDSIFGINNTCVYNSKPCEIFENDVANGKIALTLAKPTPGVNTASGHFARFTFKALNAIASSTNDIKIVFTSSGNYTDSDVIVDDGSGTDILTSVVPMSVMIAAPACNTVTYSDWSSCVDSIRTRTITAKDPLNCDPGVVVLSEVCGGGVVTCQSFNYSDWGECANGQQSRTVASSVPSGCVNGSPVLTQTCSIETVTATTTTTTTTAATTTSSGDKDDGKKKDKTKPRFTDLPITLSKRRGETVWWKAKDNKGISYYRYSFDGKTIKTKRRQMTIPATTSRGPKVLNVKAYDRAGNSASRRVLIWVR